jgi:hypothetical protein
MLQFSPDPRLAEEQMTAIIFYLTTFGYIDGDFDGTERVFVRDQIRELVKKRYAGIPAPLGGELTARQTAHYLEIFEQIDTQIQELFTEVVADGESLEEFVVAKLKLRCFEIFRGFDEQNRRALLDTVDEFINADGVAHPSEIKFRNELAELFKAELMIPAEELEVVEEIREAAIHIEPAVDLSPRQENHPFFQGFEEHYSRDPEIRRRQAAADYNLMDQVMAKLEEQRAAGAGKLKGKATLAALAGEEPFLDGHVYVHPPTAGRSYELIVFGDLHGCYSCLKAGLLQFDFFNKVQAFKRDPENNPDVKVVLLGDYIDRGKFSYNGVLRAVLKLFATVPEHVYVLRGNHEYYIEYAGKIYGGVKPAEAINTLSPYMPKKMFEAYMRFFDALPNMLFFEKTLFVHAGIPRDELLRERYRDLSSLNDPDIRFQMLWSDPANADFVPAELQKQNARFPFGKKQFQAFMAKVGANLMVRGHEKIDAGFKKVFDEPEAVLLSLFSAGGENNDDLPLQSSYRSVTPMAMVLRHKDGETSVTPLKLDYERYNDPQYNAFFQKPPEIMHKVD